MTHILAALFFLAVMAASLHLIALTIGGSWQRILQALAGEEPQFRVIKAAERRTFRTFYPARVPVRRSSIPLRAAA